MKRTMFQIFVFTAFILLTISSDLKALDVSNNDANRTNLEKSFNQLTANCFAGMKEALRNAEQARVDGADKDLSLAKFRIAEVQVPNAPTSASMSGSTSGTSSSSSSTMPSSLGVRVWFELTDGTMFNPNKRKWSNKEQFYIHIQTSVPIYVSLYQNYPDSRPASRQIYPDKKYPEGFKVLQPGQSTRLPVLFETDDDLRTEIMSIVVVRADWTGIQTGLSTPATTSVVNNEGKPTITAQVTYRGAGTMKCLNDRAVINQDLTAEQTKEIVSSIDDAEAAALSKTVNEEAENLQLKVSESEKETSNVPEDVCFYMFGAGNVGQWQLTIQK